MLPPERFWQVMGGRDYFGSVCQVVEYPRIGKQIIWQLIVCSGAGFSTGTVKI